VKDGLSAAVSISVQPAMTKTKGLGERETNLSLSIIQILQKGVKI
jgi:hypothetical protein